MSSTDTTEIAIAGIEQVNRELDAADAEIEKIDGILYSGTPPACDREALAMKRNLLAVDRILILGRRDVYRGMLRVVGRLTKTNGGAGR